MIPCGPKAAPLRRVTWRCCCRAPMALVAAAVVLMAGVAGAAERLLDGPGPWAASTRKLAAWPLAARTKDGAIAKVVADIFCPEHGRRSRQVLTRPLAVILPDQGNRPEHVAGTATHLASHGVVVAVPHGSSADAAEQAREILTLRRALAERRGVLRSEPLLQCLAQQELGQTIVVAHGRAARVVLQLEKLHADDTAALPAVVWLSPVLGQAELGIRTPATQSPGVPADPAEEHRPGMSPAELVLLPDEPSCTAGAQTFFEQSRRRRARFAITIDRATHCSFLEPGHPACRQRCGSGDPSARAAARRALTWWLAEFTGTKAPHPRQLAQALEQVEGLGDIEERPLEQRPVPLQAGVSLLMGGGLGLRGDELPSHGFAVGARPALIYGRYEDGYVGFGPFAEVLTQGLDDVVLGGGLEVVIPIYSSLGLVPSGGVAGWHRDELGWEPAITAGGFLGTRAGHNGSFLDPICGVRVDGRIGVGERSERALLIAFQGDVIAAVAYLAMGIAWAL